MSNQHRARVRKRFLTDDTNEIPDHIVLEAYLHNIIPRKDTKELAKRLLREFGSFAQVIEAPIEILVNVEGIGEAAASQIKMLPVYLRRYIKSKLTKADVVLNADEAGAILLPYFFAEEKELVYVISVGSMGRMLGCDCVAQGSFHSVCVTAQSILMAAMKYHASGVVLAHNHPFGLALPSMDDITVTKHLKETLFHSGLTLVDHLIFDGVEFVSLRSSDRGQIWPEGESYLRNGAMFDE